MSGANEGDTTATGSATVRILRPPAEAGGAPLKLEKTPTLTNESVVKLVEAGFSEGTIIKRIEDSPAAFDLSSDKLEELRRKRDGEECERNEKCSEKFRPSLQTSRAHNA